jgi:hypothetical protein
MTSYDACDASRLLGEGLIRLMVGDVVLTLAFGQPLGALADKVTVFFDLGGRQGYEDRVCWGDSTWVVW